MPESRSLFLTFFIGEDQYAVPLSRVTNALGLEGITSLPGAPRHVLGLLNLDGAALPVLDLAARFGAEAHALGDRPSVLAVRLRLDDRVSVVGLVVSRLGRVLSLSLRQLHEPGLVTSLVPAEFLQGLLPMDDRFVMFLDVDSLLDVGDSRAVAELSQVATAQATHEATRTVPHLVVRLASERCALALSGLREAIECGPITRVPGAPDHVLGATNVRGAIVTVLDLAQRYGIGRSAGTTERLLILADVDGEREGVPVGFVAEAIEGLVQIAPQAVKRTPPFGTRFPTGLVKGMAPFEGQLVPILDCERALDVADSSVQGRPPTPVDGRRVPRAGP